MELGVFEHGSIIIKGADHNDCSFGVLNRDRPFGAKLEENQGHSPCIPAVILLFFSSITNFGTGICLTSSHSSLLLVHSDG
jgi:hypothetical protein